MFLRRFSADCRTTIVNDTHRWCFQSVCEAVVCRIFAKYVGNNLEGAPLMWSCAKTQRIVIFEKRALRVSLPFCQRISFVFLQEYQGCSPVNFLHIFRRSFSEHQNIHLEGCFWIQRDLKGLLYLFAQFNTLKS